MTEKVCQHIVQTDYSSLDDRTVERVKTRLIDAVGVIAAGVKAPMCEEMYDLLTSYGSTEQSSAFFRNAKLNAPNAAMLNSFEMRSYDFEAIEAENHNHKSSAAHISGTTVPTAFAVAERAHASGRDFITALALGDDLASRLGEASGFDVYGGWDNTSTINGLGATAIACKLMGLDEIKMRNALGLDLNMLGGSMDSINYKTLAFKYNMANAARSAIFAADFAARGMTASHDAINGAKGYFFLFCGGKQNPDLLLDGLGEEYFGDVVFKPWSACRATHPSIDAIMQIVGAHDIDPGEVKSVVVHATPRTAAGFVGQPFEIGEDPQVSGAFSIIYTSALAVAYKCVRPEYMNREAMEDPELNKLISKISIEPSLPPDEYQTAEADITMNDGTTYHARCDAPKGDIYRNPMTKDEIMDKYYKNIEFSGARSKGEADHIADVIDHLEDLEDINALIELVK